MAKKKLTVEDVEHISIRKLASKIKAADRQIGNLKELAARKPQYALFLGTGASLEQICKKMLYEIWFWGYYRGVIL